MHLKIQVDDHCSQIHFFGALNVIQLVGLFLLPICNSQEYYESVASVMVRPCQSRADEQYVSQDPRALAGLGTCYSKMACIYNFFFFIIEASSLYFKIYSTVIWLDQLSICGCAAKDL